MEESAPFHIATLFILLIEAQLASYMWRKAGFSRNWVPIGPISFLFNTIMFLVLTAGFAAAIGFERGLFAAELAAGILLSLKDPVAAVALFIAHLILRPWDLAPPNAVLGSTVKILASSCLLSLVIYSFKRGSFRLLWDGTCSTFVALLAWLALSTVFSPDIGKSFEFFFNSFFPITVLSVLIINTVSELADLNVLLSILIVAVTGIVCTAAAHTFAHSELSLALRLEGLGMWGNSNDLASLIVLVIPYLLSLARGKERGIAPRLIGWFCMGVFLFGLLFAQSRGALVALGLCGVIYVLLRVKSVKQRFLIGIFIVAIPLLLMSVIKREGGEMSLSKDARESAIRAALLMFRANPVLGVGIGNFEQMYPFYTPMWVQEGALNAHNSWLQILAETGPLGLLLFMGLYFLTIRRAWQLRKAHPELILSLIGYGVAMSFLSHAYLISPYLAMSIVLAAVRVHAETAPMDDSISSPRQARGV